MKSAVPLTCPNCQAPFEAGTPACPSCHLRLLGTDAARLWQVRQQIDVLNAESRSLIARLLTQPAPSAAADGTAPGGFADGVKPFPVPAPGPAPMPTDGRRRGGQQLLLGLGALMLLSAAAFFLVVIWLVVGLLGQAAIMATLTGTAAGAAVIAARKHLTATAEAAAVIASGLVLIDLWAAHRLGLAGLDALDTATYWLGATLLATAVLLGFDRLLPRRLVDGSPAKRVLTYRLLAGTTLSAAGWTAFALVSPPASAEAAALLAVAAFCLVAALATRRFDMLMASPLLASAGLATLLHFALGFERLTLLGHRDTDARGGIAVATVILAAVPTLTAIASTQIVARRVGLRDHRVALTWWTGAATLPVVAGLATVVVDHADDLDLLILGVSLVAALWSNTAGRAVLVPAAPRSDAAAGPRVGRARSWVVTGYACVAQPVTFLVLWGLQAADQVATDPSTLRLWLTVAAGLVLVATTLHLGVRSHQPHWVPLAHVSGFLTALAVLSTLPDAGAHALAVALLVTCLATATVAAFRPRRSDFAMSIDLSSLAAALGYFVAGAATTMELGPAHVTALFAAAGVMLLVHATAPGRLDVAYLGSLSISFGTWWWMADRGVETVEAYTVPLACLLALIGLAQWRRRPTAPTQVTMGPPLWVLAGPTLIVAIGTGDALRLAVLTAAAVALLIAGLARRWQAAVTVSVVVLIAIAITQGGPYVSYLPGWLILGCGGAALLAAGVMWERALVTSRRATTWYQHLR